MKYFKKKCWTIILLLMFSGSVWAIAQSEQRISLNVSNVSLAEIFSAIEKQTTYHFSYRDVNVTTKRDISINKSKATVTSILDQILHGKNLTYKILSERSIVILSKDYENNPAQDKKIKVRGTVKDSKGEPMIGVTIISRGNTSAGTVTDFDGNFELNDVEIGSKLLISYIGYKTQEVKAGSSPLIIKMMEDKQVLDEVVVVGYGSQKKVNLTGSVSSINFTKESMSRPVVNVSQALSGAIPGMQVMQSSGNPYSEGFDISIRGVGSLNSSGPLVLVDGMEQSLSNVNPIDIETISVLKDAASCAIYGNRGANGVILITTKTGKGQEKMSVDISAKMSVNSPMRVPQLVNNYADYMELMNESYTNLGRPIAFTEAVINLWREKEKDPNGISESGYPNYVAYPNTDWYKAIYGNALMQEYTVQLSGTQGKTGYNFSLGYQDNNGILKNSGSKRYTVRSNIYSDVTNWLRVGSRIWGYVTDRDRIGTSVLTSMDMTKIVPGTYPYYDGKYGAPESNEEDPQSHNALWDMNYEHGDMKYCQLFTNVYSQIKFLKHFTYDFGLWYKHYIYDGKYASNAYPKWSFSLNDITADAIDLKTATTGQTYNRECYWKFNHLLNYNQSFGKHDIAALLGFEESRFWSRTANVTMKGLIDPFVDDIDAGTEFSGSYGNNSEYTSRSYFGRLNYSYASKYLFEANFRYDGSSRFAPDHRWGLFPSASFGWRISEEGFMEGTKEWLSNLKLRGSWGKLGNNSIGNYEWIQTYALVNYPFASKTNLGLAPTSQANELLQWEKTSTIDLGLDFGVLNNKLSGSIDIYNKLTSGILYKPSIMLIYGNISAARQNIAEVTNKGIELQLTWRDNIEDFKYSISGNISFNKNEVSKYKGKLQRGWVTNEDGKKEYVTNLGDVSTGSSTRVVEGHEINEYYMLNPYKGNQRYFNANGSVNPKGGPKTGMIRTEEDMKWLNAMVNAGYVFYPNQKIGKSGIWYGDYIYADLNGDGIYGNEGDKDFTGNSSVPKINFGMQMTANWKNFDLSMNWYGVAGNKLYFYRNGQNASTTIKGYAIGKDVAYDHYFFDPENPNDPKTNIMSKNPRLTNNSGSSQSESTNTLWLYNGDFLKLKNLTIGYTVPYDICKKMLVKNLRVFASGENLFTITKYPGIDPEMRTSINYLTYRQFAFGLDITF